MNSGGDLSPKATLSRLLKFRRGKAEPEATTYGKCNDQRNMPSKPALNRRADPEPYNTILTNARQAIQDARQKVQLFFRAKPNSGRKLAPPSVTNSIQHSQTGTVDTDVEQASPVPGAKAPQSTTPRTKKPASLDIVVPFETGPDQNYSVQTMQKREDSSNICNSNKSKLQPSIPPSPWAVSPRKVQPYTERKRAKSLEYLHGTKEQPLASAFGVECSQLAVGDNSAVEGDVLLSPKTSQEAYRLENISVSPDSFAVRRRRLSALLPSEAATSLEALYNDEEAERNLQRSRPSMHARQDGVQQDWLPGGIEVTASFHRATSVNRTGRRRSFALTEIDRPAASQRHLPPVIPMSV